jgi:ATP-dependent protease ClpP protease subunit
MTKYAFAMIHELSSGIGRSNYTKIKTYSEFLGKVDRSLVNIYMECRGYDKDDKDERNKLEKKLLEETWMSSEEYKLHKFVDEII